MGSWGIDPYENDDGSEINEIWDDFIADSIYSWGEDKIFSFFKTVYFKGNLPIISDGTSASIIAISKKFEDNSLSIPEELKISLAEALSLELSKSSLSEWGSEKKKREKMLSEMAVRQKLSINPDINSARLSSYTDEIESLKVWFQNIEKINGVRETKSIKTFDFIDTIKPEFGKMIEKSTWEFYDENDEDGSAELGNLRYMYLLWLILFDLKYSSDDIVEALEREKL